MSAVLVLGGVAMWCVFVLAGVPGGGFATGVYVGAVGMAALSEFRVRSGSAPIHRGADAEVLVDELLRESVPHGWVVRSGISFAGWDIDHLIIGDAMVVMVETKSTASQWRLTDGGVLLNGSDPTGPARRSLTRARQLITGGASSRIDGQAWLVIDSASNPERDALLPTTRNDVHILKPRHLATHIKALPAIQNPERLAANVIKVDHYLSRRADRQRHEAASVY